MNLNKIKISNNDVFNNEIYKEEWTISFLIENNVKMLF